MVDEGGVGIVQTTARFTEAFVRGDRYPVATILYHNGTFSCTCEKGLIHHYSHELCTHALALRLAVADEAAVVSPIDQLAKGEIKMSAVEQVLRGRITRTQWGLLGQWWCMPLDCTPEEIGALAIYLREELGPDFAACPLDYIKDRLFGGFACGNDDVHRHIYFAVGNYSFLAAMKGQYWKATSSDRASTWDKLLEENGDCYPGDGPFTSDAPSVEKRDDE